MENLLKGKKKRYRNNLIVYLLAFIPCLSALIGFNIFLLFPPTNFLLALLLAVAKQFAVPINIFLIVFSSLIGLLLTLTVRSYLSIVKTEENQNIKMERVSLGFDLSVGNYIEKIFYELETDKAVMFGRNEDDKVFFIPKSVIKGGWSKDKNKEQKIVLKFEIHLYWKQRKTVNKFDIKFKDFRFSDEVLMKGTFKLTSEFTKVQFQHYINILNNNLINIRERKIRFHFRLIMRPDIGEINFDGECILESLQQNKIHSVISTKSFRSIMDKFLLKNSCNHAEKFAKQENFPFPNPYQILRGLFCPSCHKRADIERRSKLKKA